MKRLPLRPVVILLAIFCLAHAAAAKDEWIQVRTKNFFLIGNASEKDVRRVASRLEQFRETFRLLFQNVNLVSPIGTNVVVFKSDSAYKPFKPKRADGKIDNFVAGFFQPGEDVNYITLAVGGEDQETYRTIFHEYVHFIVNANFGKSEVPPWFNEGLAEYYSTFDIANDQVVKLGLLIDNHLEMLQRSQLMPLDQLFAVGNRQLLNTGDHSRTIFYAESWALIHYLIQGKKNAELGKFLDAVLKGVPREQAFKEAFQQDYASMFSALKNYVGKNSYTASQFTFSKKLDFESEMQASPLSTPLSNAYLGDLLYHNNREDDAEPYLLSALKDDPSITMATTALGMVKLRQRKFDEARQYLEAAIKGDQRSASALYRYAYLLSREGVDEYGIRKDYAPGTLAKMRDALKRAIAADPAFIESYDLLAYVDLAAKDNYTEAASAMQAALKLNPGNDKFLLRLAEIYMEQEKFDDARKIADKISHTSDDADVLQRSARILQYLDMRSKYEQQRAEFVTRQRSETIIAAPSSEDLEKANAIEALRSINRELRQVQQGENRVIGSIERIDCSKRPLLFTIRTQDTTFTVSSQDFETLVLNGFDGDTSGREVGCDSKISSFNALITYKDGPPTIGNKGPRGQLIAIEFVPRDFRILSPAEMEAAQPVLIHRGTPPSGQSNAIRIETADGAAPSDEQIRSSIRDAVRQQMLAALPQPKDGEKRELGQLDKVECSGKGIYFIIRTSTGVLRLQSDESARPPIRLFTPDLAGTQFGCAVKPIEYPAVVVYRASTDAKSKSQGTVTSLSFMPKGFTLD